MIYYIEKDLFKTLCRLVLTCGKSINPNIYFSFFHNKTKMTVVDYFKFRKEIIKDLKINNTILSKNLYDKYNTPAIMSLKRILNIVD
jgi:hypothetical protein